MSVLQRLLDLSHRAKLRGIKLTALEVSPGELAELANILSPSPTFQRRPQVDGVPLQIVL